MDAEGYLKSHGWRGLGYSLDKNDQGLKKPLLVSQKIDVLGVGKQRHQAQADQWWMRAFDESLKSIGTGQKTTLDSVRQNGISKGGLYGFFVKGQALEGTISDTPTSTSSYPTEPTMARPTLNEITSTLSKDILEQAKQNVEKKRKKEPSKKRKLDEYREAAHDDGKADREEAERKLKEAEIDRIVKKSISKRLRAGEFGPVVPHMGPTPKKIFDSQTGKMVNYKDAKIKREKNKRVAKAEEKLRVTKELYPDLLPPTVENGATQEEVFEYQKQERAKKAEKKAAKRERVEREKAAFETKKEAKRLAKLGSRKAADEEKGAFAAQQTATTPDSESPDTKPANVEPADTDFDPNAEVVSLVTKEKGKTKKIPGVGPVERYPSKGEKKLTKLNAAAARLGLTLEQYQKELQAEKDLQGAPERERIAKVQASRGGLNVKEYKRKTARERDAEANNIYFKTGKFPVPGELAAEVDVNTTTPMEALPAKEPEWHELSEKKRKQYAERAAEKGQTSEEYYARRIEKKARLADATTLTANGNAGVAFVVDTVGDSKLSSQTSKSLATHERGPGEPFRWHPDMLGDRKVKELTKTERKARLEYMRARRAARHVAAGRDPTTRKEKRRQKMERKMEMQRGLTSDILKRMAGGKGEEVSKEKLLKARRAAKKEMRVLKKEKRNKVILRG